jgi:hypothetical protein
MTQAFDYSGSTSISSVSTFDGATGIVNGGKYLGMRLSDYFTPENAQFVCNNNGNWSLSGINSWSIGDTAYSFIGEGGVGAWSKTPNLGTNGGNANSVPFTPIPGLSATTVQDAIQEILNTTSSPQYISSTTVGTYQAVYQLPDGTLGLAIATSDLTANCIGFALNSGTATSGVNAQSSGYITIPTLNLTIGQTVYLSPFVAGAVTQTPAVSGQYSMILGVASAPDTIRLNLVYNGLIW